MRQTFEAMKNAYLAVTELSNAEKRRLSKLAQESEVYRKLRKNIERKFGYRSNLRGGKIPLNVVNAFLGDKTARALQKHNLELHYDGDRQGVKRFSVQYSNKEVPWFFLNSKGLVIRVDTNLPSVGFYKTLFGKEPIHPIDLSFASPELFKHFPEEKLDENLVKTGYHGLFDDPKFIAALRNVSLKT
ncbi:MAG: hypothetical protein ABH803_00935 [Candidatus Micrarchaeota archaeon]